MFEQAEWNLTEKKIYIPHAKRLSFVLKPQFVFLLLLFQGPEETNLENEGQEFYTSCLTTC